MDLKATWSTRCRPGHSEWTWAVLRTLYNTGPRHYHTLRHVEQVLGVLSEMNLHAEFGYAAATLAAFWHDAVYVPGSDDNESESAGLLESISRSLVAPWETVELAAACVRRTRDHKMPAGDFLRKQTWRTVAAFLDADMSVLGSAEHDYDLYAEQVRAEYAAASDEQWRAGRSEFLRRLLAQPNVYILGWSKDRFESSARGNMQRELEKLGG